MTAPTPPQPNTGDERLKELIRNLPKTVWPTDSNYPNWWKVDIDEVISLFKAELGTAQRGWTIELPDLPYFQIECTGTTADRYWKSVICDTKNLPAVLLRNHFGIGEDV